MTLNFYYPAAKLGIEIDGEAHSRADQPERDARRDAFLASRGIRVLRITAADILRQDGLDAAIRGIVAAARQQGLR